MWSYTDAFAVDRLLEFIRPSALDAAALLVGFEHGFLSPEDLAACVHEVVVVDPENVPDWAIGFLTEWELRPEERLEKWATPEGRQRANELWTYLGALQVRRRWEGNNMASPFLHDVVEEFDVVRDYELFTMQTSKRSFVARYGNRSFLEALDAQLASDRRRFGRLNE